LAKTTWVTVLCGLGHVGSSVLLGMVGIALGIGLTRVEATEGFRGADVLRGEGQPVGLGAGHHDLRRGDNPQWRIADKTLDKFPSLGERYARACWLSRSLPGKITSVETFLLRFPVDPFTYGASSKGWIRDRSSLLVRVKTDAGVEGWGAGAAPGTRPESQPASGRPLHGGDSVRAGGRAGPPGAGSGDHYQPGGTGALPRRLTRNVKPTTDNLKPANGRMSVVGCQF
jgi:hypothetical protein